MRRVAIVLLVVAACGKNPDRDKARKACEHTIELSSANAESFANYRFSDHWQRDMDDCTNGMMEDSSPAHVDCIIAARTMDEWSACHAS